jgi:hypothetical protein
MKMTKFAGALGALAVSLTMATAANADTYNLNLTDAQSALPAPYGQVEVTQGGAGTLNFVVTLFDGLKFVDTGMHWAFSFSLNGAPALTFSGPSGFALTTDLGDIKNAPFDGFDYGVSCGSPACGSGGSSPFTGPLAFSISGTGLTLAMLGTANDLYNGQTIRFAADTISQGARGATGTIGGGTLVPSVPEPATWAMMILGMGMVGMGLRMRRRTVAVAA